MRVLTSNGQLAAPILKATIIALHQSMFEADYYKGNSSPRAKDKRLDAMIDAVSAANHLAIHYGVYFGEEMQIDKMMLMLADKGKPEPDNLGALEIEWKKELDSKRNLL